MEIEWKIVSVEGKKSQYPNFYIDHLSVYLVQDQGQQSHNYNQ